jgi:hypothetical protein
MIFVFLLLKRWKKYPLPTPHVTGDSAFGSISLIEWLNSQNCYGTFSVAQNNMTYLWNALSVNLPTNTWRMATKGNKVASVSVHVAGSGTESSKNVLSNFFNVTEITNTEESSSPLTIFDMPLYNEEQLKKFKVNNELKPLCTKWNIPHGK